MEKVGGSTEQKKLRRRRLVPSPVSRLASPCSLFNADSCMYGWACSIKLEIPRTLCRVSESGVLRRSSNRHRERFFSPAPSPHSPDPNTSPCIPALDVAMPLARYDRRSLSPCRTHISISSQETSVVGTSAESYLSFKPGSVNDLRRGLRRGIIVCVSDWRMVRWQLHGLHGGSACPYLVHAVCLSLRK